MRILREPVDFDWDFGNLNKNFYKHQVTNKEAEEVFLNEPKFNFKDQKHSTKKIAICYGGQLLKDENCLSFIPLEIQKLELFLPEI